MLVIMEHLHLQMADLMDKLKYRCLVLLQVQDLQELTLLCIDQQVELEKFG